MKTARAIVFHNGDLLRRVRSEHVVATAELATALAALADASPLTLVGVIADNGREPRDALVRAARLRWPNVPVVLICRSESAALHESARRLRASKIVGEIDTLAGELAIRIHGAERRREAQCIVASLIAARYGLSRAEHDCVRLLAYGVPRSALGAHLGKARRTVEAALASIFRKLDVRSTTEIAQVLLHAAIDAGLQADRGWLDTELPSASR